MYLYLCFKVVMLVRECGGGERLISKTDKQTRHLHLFGMLFVSVPRKKF